MRPNGSPQRITLRSFGDPFEPSSAIHVYRKNLIGSNVGNLVFLQASQRILTRSDTTVLHHTRFQSKRDADKLNERSDHLVVPLANAFRKSFADQLEMMTAVIRDLKIPVTILGVGAQATLRGNSAKMDAMAEKIQAFVAAVLDRGPSIGVRGEFTADYLKTLGFGDAHVRVIGCPSLFHYGPELPALREPATPLGPSSKIAINISPYVSRMGPILKANLDRYPDLIYVAQDINTLGLMLGHEYQGSGKHPDVPLTRDHRVFHEGKIIFCLSPRVWYEQLAQRDFSFGTRIHGNIAALLAGTPAVVLAHDSRTLELTRYFEIPARRISKVSESVDPAKLYARADFTGYVSGHAERWSRFESYLHEHALRHAFEDGGTPEDFDRRIAEAKYPGPVIFDPADAGPGKMRRRPVAAVVKDLTVAADAAVRRTTKRHFG